MKKIFSIILVWLQFICIIVLSLTGQKMTVDASIVLSLGIIIGLWAIFVMRKSKLHVTPDVDRNAILVTSGPYHYIRHPMYTAVLLVCFGLLLTAATFFRVGIYMFLVGVLAIKLFYEEQLLERHFSQYKKYKQTTTRLIPFLF